MKEEKKSKFIFIILAIICIAMFCFAITPKELQNDTFYTVKIGEYIYENGISNLTEDVYSWHDLPYTYPHWLYDLGTYVVFRAFAWDGVYWLTVILSVVLGLSLFYISNKLSKNTVISFVVTLGAMYLLKPFVAARAQLLTFILFAWTVYFIEKFLETHKVRYAVYLILIPLIIANVHCAVFPFYFVLYLPYIGEYFIAVLADLDLDKRFGILCLKIARFCMEKVKIKKSLSDKIEKLNSDIKERKEKRVKLRANPYKIKVQKNHFVLLLIAVAVIAALTGFINPTGLGAYTYTWKTMQGNTTQSINEHLPLALLENKEFAVTLLAFLAILMFTDTKIKLSDLFMLGGLGYLAFKMRRQVSMFAIFGCFILVKMIASFLNKYDAKLCDKIMRIATRPIGTILILAIVGYISFDLYYPIKDNEYISEATYPVAASKWIKENLDLSELKLYNEYNYGSYLLYEGIPVFIDSRCDLYSPEFNEDSKNNVAGRDIFSDALNIAGIAVNYDVKFKEYGVNHIISYSNSKLSMLLSNDEKYRQIYDDGIFKIFSRIETEKTNN